MYCPSDNNLTIWFQKLLTTLVLKAVLVYKGIEQSSEYVSEILLRLFSDVDKSFGEDECVSYGMVNSQALRYLGFIFVWKKIDNFDSNFCFQNFS